MNRKIQLIDRILTIELNMFLAVPSQQAEGCQRYPDQFKHHRKAQFMAWSESTLASYFKDLKDAQTNNENLMTFKYARMENLLPPRFKRPLVKKMVAIQLNWQREMFKKYPALMKRARSLEPSSDTVSQTSFETYLSGELESYSEHTLHCLYQDIQDKLKHQINMAEEIYDYLVRAMGYESLVQVEKSLGEAKKKVSDKKI
ncbi:DUF4125 family protein [Desulfobacula sp.]|uniref:DUF4125 family protein n=1 Tax=Desulfobacula sp. TaxID=2593537 RepID=UPI00263808C6|nr:DUF4125 family protein [Desulfobacula sp.]